MPGAYRVLPESDSNHHAAMKQNTILLTFVLVSLVLFLSLSVLPRTNSGNSIAPSADARSTAKSPSTADDSTAYSSLTDYALEDASASASQPGCTTYVAWPNAFEIPFTSYFVDTRYGPWDGNSMQYEHDAASDTMYFHSSFSHCTNLTGVPLSFFGEPCEYFFTHDPQHNNQYNAYVYSTKWQKYFLLATNFGPQWQDFVARYQKLLPSCQRQPYPGSHWPVGNPPGVAVYWFVTSGNRINPPTSATNLGYYAAVARLVTGPDGKYYNPPYSFGGAVHGIHKPGTPTRMVAGQLVYEWKKFRIVDSIPLSVFTPPTTGYTEIAGTPMNPQPPRKAMNCPVCHVTDPSSATTFYTEARRHLPK